MKLMIAAALAVIAVPAMGQDTPPAAPAPAPMPMAAPAAMTMGPSTPVVQPLPDAAAPAGDDAPWCSKTVTDHCKERSNARGERLHSTPRPHK
jgi:hypothetical protein